MFKIRKSKDGQFYFVVVARNGKITATSETYTKRVDCRRGAKALRRVVIGCKDKLIKYDY